MRVTGRLVIATSPRLRAKLLDVLANGASPVLIIDVSEVAHLDTSGIATLIEPSQLARSRGVHLRTTGFGGEPRILAQATELDRGHRRVEASGDAACTRPKPNR